VQFSIWLTSVKNLLHVRFVGKLFEDEDDGEDAGKLFEDEDDDEDIVLL